jgi:hypothetical protein
LREKAERLPVGANKARQEEPVVPNKIFHLWTSAHTGRHLHRTIRQIQ